MNSWVTSFVGIGPVWRLRSAIAVRGRQSAVGSPLDAAKRASHHLCAMNAFARSAAPLSPLSLRFELAWTMPVAVGLAALYSPWMAWLAGTGFQVGMACVELLPWNTRSPAAVTHDPCQTEIA